MLSSPEAAARAGAHPYDGAPLALLSGVGRSGTNAVRDALGRHPGVDSTGCENNIVNDVLRASLRNCTMPSRRVAMRVGRDDYLRAFRTLLLSLLWPDAHDPAPTPHTLLAYANLDEDLCEHLAEAFPGARIVQLLRHPVEVVASRMLYPAFSAAPFEDHCDRWAAAARTALRLDGRDDAFVLRHERLLDAAGARESIDTLLRFLGLPAHGACAEALITARPHPTRDEGEPESAATDLRTRIHRWRTWTPAQRESFERRCAAPMRALGYDLPW